MPSIRALAARCCRQYHRAHEYGNETARLDAAQSARLANCAASNRGKPIYVRRFVDLVDGA